MQATAGDRLLIMGRRIRAPERDGEILEVRGQDGRPPYLVRWSDTGRTTLFFPGSDARIEHLERRPTGSGRR